MTTIPDMMLLEELFSRVSLSYWFLWLLITFQPITYLITFQPNVKMYNLIVL